MLEKLGFTAENIKELQENQKKAAKQAEAAKKAAKQAEQQKKNQKKKEPKTIQVKNTNSLFGQALASAFATGGAPVAAVKEEPAKKQETAPTVVATGEDLSHLSGMIRDKKKLAEELGIGELTLVDIIKELEKPGRDPREEMPKPILRTDVLEMKDLTEGMILKGTVRNVIDFGVFVDIGVHQDGLVHISQITNKKFIKHPLEAVSVGDIVDVKVMSVDVAKKRIQLTMIM